MISYGQSDRMRAVVDAFQTRKSCCGNIDVRGWFDVPTWSTESDVQRGLLLGFPQSCCNIDVEQIQTKSANRSCVNLVTPEQTNELSATFENGCYMALVEMYRLS
jgi:hypothetical protein